MVFPILPIFANNLMIFFCKALTNVGAFVLEDIMNNVGDGVLQDVTRVIIETEEENPIAIATITADKVIVAEGYRVRLTPNYDD